jgi:hypothetical protein
MVWCLIEHRDRFTFCAHIYRICVCVDILAKAPIKCHMFFGVLDQVLIMKKESCIYMCMYCMGLLYLEGT